MSILKGFSTIFGKKETIISADDARKIVSHAIQTEEQMEKERERIRTEMKQMQKAVRTRRFGHRYDT